MKQLLTVFIVISILTSAQNLYAQKIKLRINLKEGAQYEMRSLTDQKISQTIMGMSNDITQKIEMGMSVTVKGADKNKDVEVGYVYDEVNYYQKTQLGEINYESKTADLSDIKPGAVGFAALIGESFTLKMTELGKIIESKGLENVGDNALELLKINDPAQREKLKKEFADNLSPEKLAANLSATAPFPEKAIEVGSTWEHDAKMDNGYPLSIHSVYTVKSISSKTVELSVSSKINSIETDAPTKINGMEMMYKLSGTQNGIQIIDRDSGWTNETKLTQNISGTVTLLPSETIPDGMTWPLEILSDIVLTSKKR